MNVQTRKTLEANIWKYYAYHFLSLFMFFGALIVVYFKDLGFTMFQISTITAGAWIFSFLLEVPSGIAADHFGRKKTLIISSVAYIASMIILAFTKQYIFIMGFAIADGLKLAFQSGSDSALLYDSLVELGREKEHPKITGRAISFFLMGVAISAPIGSTIAKYTSIQFTIILTIGISIISLFIALSFKEPKMHKKLTEHHYIQHLKDSLHICFTNKKLKWLIIMFSVLQGVIVTTFIFHQAFLETYKTDIAMYGWINLALIIFATATSHSYDKIHKKIKDMKLFRIIAYSLPLVFLAMGLTKNIFAYLPAMLGLEIIFGLYSPSKDHYVNKEIESDKRATILSVMGFLSSVGVAFFQMATGAITDLIGIHMAYVILSIVTGVILLISIKKLTKHYI